MSWVKTSFFFLYFGLAILVVGFVFLAIEMLTFNLLISLFLPVILGAGLILVFKFMYEFNRENHGEK